MKINNDELERALLARQLQQQRAQPQKGSSGEGFEGILAQQFSQAGQTSGIAGAAAGGLGLEALAGSAKLASLNLAIMSGEETADSGDEQNLAMLDENLAGLLNGLDGYAKNLGDGKATMKDAWNTLSGLDASLAQAKQTLGRLSKPDPGLESMVNELEILSATEKFKINRGDYLV